jgi:hypothetical protein
MELTQEQYAILTHVYADPDELIEKSTDDQLLASIEANTEDYLLHKDDPKYETKAQENQSVLKHCIVDPDAWVTHAIATVGQWAVDEKIAKYRQDYLDHKYDDDYQTRAERDAPKAPTAEEIKKAALNALLQAQSDIQKAGFTCTNGIKLQVEDNDLINWTQLMAGITAFQPETVTIRDYNDINHTLALAVVTQMLQEVFAWGQWFFQDTWAKKDAILNS